MTDPGTIAALIGLGNQLAECCESIVQSLRNLPAKANRSSHLGDIGSYCAIIQAAINQICTWASTKLPKSSIPTSSVIAVQATTADILEFIRLLHSEVRGIVNEDEVQDTTIRPAEARITLAKWSYHIQKLASGLQLMLAATMMPIEDTRSILLAISHANESITSYWKAVKADWDIKEGLSNLSLEESLLSSPVYRRVSRYELDGNGISTERIHSDGHVPASHVVRTTSMISSPSQSRQHAPSQDYQSPFLDTELTVPDNVFNRSPSASNPPSFSTETNQTLGQESQVHLLPIQRHSEISSSPTGLIAIQPGLIPVEQAGLIAVESKFDARTGLIPANENRLSPLAKQNSSTTSSQSLILSLDGDGFLGSYCHLLVLQSLFQKIATLESSESTGDSSSLDLMATHYFDEIVGTGTGGLLAILLGRLQLPLGECIDAFKEMGRKLLDPHNFNTSQGLSPVDLAIQYRNLLKHVVRGTLQTYSHSDPAGASFYKTDKESCRTVITSFDLSYSGSSTGAHTFYSSLRSRDKTRTRELIRGYRNPEIWRVCLATLEHRLSVQPSLLKSVPFIDETVQEKSPAVRLYRKIVSDNGNNPQSVKALICMGTRERSGKAATSQPWNYSYDWLSKQNQPWGVTCYRFEIHRKFKAFSLDGGNIQGVDNKLSSAEMLAEEYLTSEVVQNGLVQCAKLLVGSRQQRSRAS